MNTQNQPRPPWRLALDDIEQVQEAVEELPENCHSAGGWSDTLGNMAVWIEEHKHVTPRMLDLIESITAGVHAWSRDR